MLLLVCEADVCYVRLLLVVGVVFCADVHEVNEPEFEIVVEEIVLNILFKLLLLYLKLRQVLDYVRIRLQLIRDVLNELELVRRQLAAVISHAL